MSTRRTLGTGGARAKSIAWLTVLAVLAVGSAPAYGYTRLNLIAGGHADGGFSGDGGPAQFAWLDDPSGVATDAAGNLYVADSHNFRIRRIDTNGRIATVAGNGRYGAPREGARATATPLYVPTDIATDGRGNLYILVGSKTGPATRVLVLDGAGILRSFAGADTPGFAGDGGPAVDALLDSAMSLAADADGNVYIGELTRVRRVDANGIISTIAGTGAEGFSGDGGPATAAQIQWASALAVDRAGNLFIASQNRVRRIDAAGTITTFAGTGIRGASGDGGPATLARIGLPGGLAVDGAGVLYISDTNHRRIRTVDAAGTIRTFAGGGRSFGHWGPALRTRLELTHDLAVDGRGQVFFTASHSVYRLEPSLEPAAAGRCTRAAATELLERRGLGNAGSLADPVAQLLCGPYAGKGSRAMVVSLRTPGCGLSIGWLVFRSENGRWKRVFSTNRGALLERAGSRIRTTQGNPRPGDAHCLPSRWRSRLWRWNGQRLVAGPWRRDDGPPRRLPGLGRAAQAAGTVITATAGRDRVQGRDRIVIADGDGGNRRILTTGEFAQISPDGTKVAVIDHVIIDFQLVATRLKVLPAAGGPALLTIPADGLRVSWSPDSAQLLATDSSDPEEQRLLLIDPASGAQTELATGRFAGASLSPDMTALAYVTLRRNADIVRGGGRLAVLDLATRTTTVLRDHAIGPVWGPDAIAFATRTRRRGRFGSDVATIKPDGTDFHRLTRVRRSRIFLGLVPMAWSADGRRILTSVEGLEGYWMNTYGVDAAHGGARLIARGVMPTAFSRDGRYVIGQTGDVSSTGFRGARIVRVPWRGGKPRVLLRRAMHASFSG